MVSMRCTSAVIIVDRDERWTVRSNYWVLATRVDKDEGTN